MREPASPESRLEPTSETRQRLGSRRGFAWLKREITPRQQQQVHRLGLPGLGFLNENKRVYPDGNEVSHLIGHVNVDNQGIAGMEKLVDSRSRVPERVTRMLKSRTLVWTPKSITGSIR